MKKLLFYYFLEKAMLKEQELLGMKDKKAAMLAIILSKMNVQHRHQSGCSLEDVYLADPKYAQELFILVCANAKAYGDNLLKYFDFKEVPLYHRGQQYKDMEDKDLTNYLEKEIYPCAQATDVIDIYTKLLPKSAEQIQDILSRMRTSFKRDANEPRETMSACEETAMIDRAWARLEQDKAFLKMLTLSGKHNHNWMSVAFENYKGQVEELLR